MLDRMPDGRPGCHGRSETVGFLTRTHRLARSFLRCTSEEEEAKVCEEALHDQARAIREDDAAG